MKQAVNYQGVFRWLFPITLAMTAVIYSYWDFVQSLVSQWLYNDDFSHGLLILPISFYLIYRKKEQLQKIPIRMDWHALPFLFFPAFIYSVGELGADVFLTRVSMLLFAIVLTWYFYGFELVKTLRFPLGFLFLCLPLPGFLYRNITFPLQILSSNLSVKILLSLGIMAFREGNIIDMGFSQFQVAEACNGLRFILPMLTVGVLFAFWTPQAWWKRLLLIAITIPLSVFANVIRIAGTGVAATRWGTEVAKGFFHSFSGWAVFMIAFAIFTGINLLLTKLSANASVPDTTADDPRNAVRHTPSWSAVAIAITIALITPYMVRFLGSVPPVTLKKPLSKFPVEMLGWHGKHETMDEKIWDRVGAQEYTIINYSNGSGLMLNFYTAFYEYQHKAGDFVHSPRLCLPGAGWFIKENVRRELPLENQQGGKLKFNELVVNKSGRSKLVYFWYQGRGRNFTSEYTAKFFLVWDGLFRRRTDGALVRLVMDIPDGKPVASVRTIMDKFASAAANELNLYLP
jgi:exosortase D (VPLPA-CTERM-specific)